MALLAEIKGLCRGQNNRQMLRQINLDVHAGELIGVIGPNGAGKSTLLKTLIGFLNFSEGQILLQGESVSSMPADIRATKISYLSQEGADSFPFPVAEVVAMGLYSANRQQFIGRQSVQKQVNEILAQLDLDKLTNRLYTELSGGEKQLVQFARVLIQKAPLMLLDEPTANLDIGHEFQLMQCLRQQCDNGRAAMVAIHNLNTAAEFCDRLVLIDQGEILASGPPETVINQQMINDVYSRQAFVARNTHTGSVNVLPRRQRGQANGMHIHLIGGAGSAINLTRQLLRQGYRLTAGVAHEHDSDASFWAANGVPYAEVPAFESISERALSQAKEWIKQADVTLLCDFPIGPANAANLELGEYAGNLILVEDSASEPRFISDQFRKKFERLKQGARSCHVTSVISELAALRDSR